MLPSDAFGRSDKILAENQDVIRRARQTVCDMQIEVADAIAAMRRRRARERRLRAIAYWCVVLLLASVGAVVCWADL
jgi:hypothetical protein